MMRYIATHANIPVPHVIYNSVEPDGGGVGSPYTVISKVDGVLLSSVWDNMEDTKHKIVRQQVIDIDILLELVSHIILARCRQCYQTKWYVPPMTHSLAIPSITYTSALDY
jgi:hypothetical protein